MSATPPPVRFPPCESALTLLLEDRQQRVDALPQIDHHAYTSTMADTKSSFKYVQQVFSLPLVLKLVQLENGEKHVEALCLVSPLTTDCLRDLGKDEYTIRSASSQSSLSQLPYPRV